MQVLEVYKSFLPQRGGVERHIYDLCTCLTNRGHKPVVLVWRPPKPPFELIDKTAVHRIRIPRLLPIARYNLVFYLSLQIAFLARKYDIDVIHAHDYLPGVASSLAGFFLRKPVVVTFHLPIWRTTYHIRRYLSPVYFFEKILERFFISYVAVIICVSKFTCQETLKLGFPRSKLKVIYNWTTHLLKYEPCDIENILKKFNLSRRRFILSVGRLVDKHKGFSMLIRALQLLTNKGCDIDLVIVGDGPDREMLMRHSLKLGVEDRVHLLSHVSDSDLACLYEGCYVFALSSYMEGLPLTLLEAMSFGKPVVATKVGGMPEVVEHERNGILVDLNSDSVTSAIERLLLNPSLNDAFSKRSQEIAKKKFSIRNCYATVNLLEKASLRRISR